jgi:hypothetical protein
VIGFSSTERRDQSIVLEPRLAAKDMRAFGIALRAVQEEQTLRAELPGYDAYLARVKYHLIPYIW